MLLIAVRVINYNLRVMSYVLPKPNYPLVEYTFDLFINKINQLKLIEIRKEIWSLSLSVSILSDFLDI